MVLDTKPQGVEFPPKFLEILLQTNHLNIKFAEIILVIFWSKQHHWCLVLQWCRRLLWEAVQTPRRSQGERAAWSHQSPLYCGGVCREGTRQTTFFSPGNARMQHSTETSTVTTSCNSQADTCTQMDLLSPPQRWEIISPELQFWKTPESGSPSRAWGKRDPEVPANLSHSMILWQAYCYLLKCILLFSFTLLQLCLNSFQST